MFVLGSHLILGVREFNAKLEAGDSEAETGITTIDFQEHARVSIESMTT